MGWVDIRKTWHDTDVEYCDVCGNLLIRRAWEFRASGGATLRACREDDERLYQLLREYAPRIEEAARARPGAGTATTTRREAAEP